MSYPVRGWADNRLVHLCDGPIAEIMVELTKSFRRGISVNVTRVHDALDLINEDSKLDNLCENGEEWMRDKYNANSIH